MKRIQDPGVKNPKEQGLSILNRKRVNTYATALCLLGMGLGVNLDETWAGMRKVPADGGKKVDVKQPSVEIDKSGEVKQPSARHGKWIDEVKQPSVEIDKSGEVKQPSVDFIKVHDDVTPPSVNVHKVKNMEQPQILKPGVNRAKPVPAAISE